MNQKNFVIDRKSSGGGFTPDRFFSGDPVLTRTLPLEKIARSHL
jgi:hypothetical protein